jgi:hypothetical protein
MLRSVFSNILIIALVAGAYYAGYSRGSAGCPNNIIKDYKAVIQDYSDRIERAMNELGKSSQ